VNERKNAIKVIVEQRTLSGSNQDFYLQRVATVYFQGADYRVYAPSRAVGDALDWLDHLSVHVSAGLNSETDAPMPLRILAIRAVEEELQKVLPISGNEGASAPIPTIRAAQPSGASAGESEDHKYARLAIEEARRSVSENDGRPHPMVGAVVVKSGNILSTAHRGEELGNHAEYVALEKRLADSAAAGATVYTTLEPCTTRNHPKIPCAERLIERKVGRVVIGMLDPDPRITGRGVRRLRSANIITELFPHDLVPEVEELNREFTRSFDVARGGAVRQHPNVVDKWVSFDYLGKSGIDKTLEEQGFELHWSTADKEAERIDFGGWQHVTVDQTDGTTARLKIHDHSIVGGYVVLLKRRKK
jgi:pyrimidine deaminase RibD-like protein